MNEEQMIGEDGYYHFIYKTTNVVTGKMYIGVHLTGNLEDGYLGSGKSFRSAIKKYGKQNFTRRVLLYCQTREEALSKEIFYIRDFRDFYGKDKLYNITDGGQGVGFGESHPMYGRTHSEESRNKMSVAGKGRKHTEETKQLIGANWIGRKHTEESKIKMSLSSFGYRHKESTKILMSESRRGEGNSFYGKKHTEETKIKLSEINKGKKHSIEVRNKMSKQHQGALNSKARSIFLNGKYFGCLKDAAEVLYPNYSYSGAIKVLNKILIKQQKEFQIAGEVITTDY